jgi:hypothetical protein
VAATLVPANATGTSTPASTGSIKVRIFERIIGLSFLPCSVESRSATMRRSRCGLWLLRRCASRSKDAVPNEILPRSTIMCRRCCLASHFLPLTRCVGPDPRVRSPSRARDDRGPDEVHERAPQTRRSPPEAKSGNARRAYAAARERARLVTHDLRASPELSLGKRVRLLGKYSRYWQSSPVNVSSW